MPHIKEGPEVAGGQWGQVLAEGHLASKFSGIELLDYSIWRRSWMEGLSKAPQQCPVPAVIHQVSMVLLLMEYIRRTCKKFQPRLEVVVANEGGHIKA